MQKTKSNLAALTLLCVGLCSCGDNSKQKKSETSLIEPLNSGKIIAVKDCSADSSFLLKSEALAMVANFQAVFQSKETGLATALWFDTCIIGGYARLLQSEDYDGVRFYNVAKSNDGNGSANPSYIIMAPTRNGNDIWGKILKVPENCSTKPNSFNLEANEANELIYNFGTAYRSEKKRGDHSSAENDSLSISIWVNKCVFEKIATAIEKKENKIDGFRIYTGAYKKALQAPGQKYNNQSTFFLIPTNADGTGGHTDNWTIFGSTVQQKSMHNLDSGALNHQTVCPNDCP